MSLLDAPADIAELYAAIDGWTRSTPWRRSMLRRDHFQATYSCSKQCYSDASSKKVASLKPVRVFVHRNVIKNSAAAWDIARQITAGRRTSRQRQADQAQEGPRP